MRRTTLTTMALAAIAVFPTTAAASTVRLETGPDGLPRAVLRAAPGERNDVTVIDQFSPELTSILTFSDGSRLIAGVGCLAGLPVVCPPTDGTVGSDAEAFLGDRSDRADVGTEVFGRTFVHGGSGSDDVASTGRDGAFAWGDDGDDSIEVNSLRPAEAFSGTGNDTLRASREGFSTVHGDDGYDLLVEGGGFGTVLDGGRDTDFLVGVGGVNSTGTMDGGSGSDVLTFVPGSTVGDTWTLLGGSGGDLITGSDLGDMVDGGSGSDLIDVTGGGVDTVTCGDGRDTVFADADDVVGADCESRRSGRLRSPELDSARAAARRSAG
jgi:hypothetical protein